MVPLKAEARRAARAAGLRYVDDAQPGVGRVRTGKTFRYVDAHGKTVQEPQALERIRMLAIPPAWTEVWICRDPLGHMQVTGRDARERKQYRYHARWSEHRNLDKHVRIRDFAAYLPDLRAHCSRLLRRSAATRDQVLAALLCIVDRTAIRVGNDAYTRDNKSFGLTTLRKSHARVQGNHVELDFRGKSGVQRKLSFHDARVAKIIKACQALRGALLFQYVDERGRTRAIHAPHLNAYLRSLTASSFSIKDFRTWSATVNVAIELGVAGPAQSPRAAKKRMLEAIRSAADYLGNTPSVCRKSYVHPAILNAYLEGNCLPTPVKGPRATLHEQERSVLAFIDALGKARPARELKRAS